MRSVAASQSSSDLHSAQADGLTLDIVRLCQRRIDSADLNCAARLLLDWIGVAFAASGTCQGKALHKMVSPALQDGTAHILGCGNGTSEEAAYVNGSYGTLLEMDDLHRASILHAGDVVVPAALAAAQDAQCSGARLLEALVVGYEVALRIGTVAAQGGYSAWYNTGTCGVFGAAMAAAHAQGLSDDEKCDALGHAGMQACGLWQCRLEPTDSKCLATAHAARAGVSAAKAAATGLRGARHILEGDLGFFPTLYPQADPNQIKMDRSGWMIHEVSQKPWPACRHVHPATGVALSLRNDLSAKAIQKIRVDSYSAGVSFCDNSQPESAHEARFSFQHCLAIALLYGPPGLPHFTASVIAAPEVRQLRDKISVAEDTALTAAFPAKMGASVTISLADRTEKTHRVEHALGDPDMPMSITEQQTKFITNLGAAGIPSNDAQSLIEAVTDLPNAATLRELVNDLHRASDASKRHDNKDLIP